MVALDVKRLNRDLTPLFKPLKQIQQTQIGFIRRLFMCPSSPYSTFKLRNTELAFWHVQITSSHKGGWTVLDGVPIRYDKPIKSPFIPEHVRQEPTVLRNKGPHSEL